MREKVVYLNNYKKLLGNSVIFAIGNLGSKLISIILVPLYTYYLTTSEYGMVDIVTTTSNMLLPIISCCIYDAVLRFVMDKNQDKDKVITNALLIVMIGLFILILLYPVLVFLGILEGLLKYMIVILALQAFQAIFSQFVRGIGEIKIYALNGIIMTIVTGIMNIILLINFNLGIDGYLLSIIIGNIASIIFLVFAAKIYKHINIQEYNKHLMKNMLVYSVPLIPNAFMWWIINASSRYFILFFVGAGANGLFAVANKIPSLLSILNTIFFQAWQLSAIEEYDSKNKSEFYSEVFNYFSMVMFIGASAIIVVLKYIINFSVSNDYFTAWKFVPFLLLGVIFSSFSGFLGTNYIAAKQTAGVFRTSVIGGAVNVLSNIIFVPLIGTNGAGVSTMISFFVIWTLRVYDTKRFINMKLDIKNIFMNLFIISIQIGILYFEIDIFSEFIIEFLLFLVLLLINKNLFKPIKKLIIFKIKK